MSTVPKIQRAYWLWSDLYSMGFLKDLFGKSYFFKKHSAVKQIADKHACRITQNANI